jgi:rSAM/selenodomain-associated transferase 2
MPLPLSVIIPALDEEARVGAAIDSAFAAGAAEVLVCDGGSRDATLTVAQERGARIITTACMRARQLNRGAAEATQPNLLFLHADTLLPAGAGAAVCQALEHALFGGFRLAFTERSPRLRVAEMLINFRTFFSKCPWGDQAQFIRRERFLALGGYREIPIMEDYELAVKMKRSGPTVVLPLKVSTSGRRFLAKGVWRTAATNWRIIIAYRLGADPQRLAELYRR